MPLYFANAGYLEDKVLESIARKPQLRFVIIDMESITAIDATGEEVLSDLTERLRALGVELLLSRTKVPIQEALDHAGYTSRLGLDHFFRTRDDAINYALEHLGVDAPDNTPLRPVRWS